MRRRVFKPVFPVILLAFLVRIVAPGGITIAMHDGASPAAPDCSAMAAGMENGQQTPPGNHQHDSDQCCLYCHAAYAIDPGLTVASFATSAPLTLYVTWAKDPAASSKTQLYKHSWARGPPQYS